MDFDEKRTALPFSAPKQTAILGHLLANERFFQTARATIEPGWFADPFNTLIYKLKLGFYERFKRSPSQQEILDEKEVRQKEQREQIQINAQVNLAGLKAGEYGIDKLSEELTKWVRSTKLQEAVAKAEKQFNAENIDGACDILRGFGRGLEDLKFGATTNEVDFTDTSVFSAIQEGRKNGLTFGLTQMDRLLNPYFAHGGGMFPGDTTLLLGPTGAGKTATMLTVAAANILQGKSVLLITHEGTEHDIVMKIWQSLTQKDQGELFKLYNSNCWSSDQVIRTVTSKLTHNYTYLPLNRAGQTVDEVEAIIRRKNDEMIERTGRGYDLVIDDYPAKLSTKEQKGGAWARRQVDELIYNRFVDLAGELKYHSLVAIQANREANKISHGVSAENRLLVMEDASESFGPMTSATNVITITRPPPARVVYYKLCKSRSSEVGQVLACTSELSRQVAHSDYLPWAWYYGGLPMGDKVDQLLKNHAAQMIPHTEVAQFG